MRAPVQSCTEVARIILIIRSLILCWPVIFLFCYGHNYCIMRYIYYYINFKFIDFLLVWINLLFQQSMCGATQVLSPRYFLLFFRCCNSVFKLHAVTFKLFFVCLIFITSYEVFRLWEYFLSIKSVCALVYWVGLRARLPGFKSCFGPRDSIE